MNELYYSSSNGEREGRASHFFKDKAIAEAAVTGQNSKAESMGVKTRYVLTTCLDSSVAGELRKSIR